MQDADLKPLAGWTRRPLFSPSQTLTAEQLNAMQDRQRAQSAMLMRALHGYGVIFGFAVALHKPKDRPGGGFGSTKLAIGSGMALDRHGRLLHWSEATIDYSELVGEPECAGNFTLSAHYAERRTPGGGCGPCADRAQWVEDGVVFRLTRGGRDPDHRCPRPEEGACVGLCEYVCLRTGSRRGTLPPGEDLESAGEGEGVLCRIECSDTYYDADAGIPLTSVTVRNLAREDCPPVWGFTQVARACAVRPYVYRTPLLFELVRGCHHNLARVASLSWEDWIVDPSVKDWEFEVPWKDLEARFRNDGLTISFTKPIDVKTVHPGSVFLTTRYWETGADYFLMRRIPALLRAATEGDFATEFRLVVDKGWLDNEFGSRATLREGGAVELTVRGQMLRDRCGNMLNAVPLFYDPRTPRQSCPGGDFIAIFSFGAAPPVRQPRPAPKKAVAPQPRQKY